MAKEKYYRETISFKVDKVEHKFEVVHNLREYGMSLEAAFTNWLFRTKEYTVENLCNYVKSKDPMIKCYPAENLDKLTK